MHKRHNHKADDLIMSRKKNMIPIILICVTCLLILLNFLALLRIIPLFITLPLLFISIYCTLYSIRYRQRFRRNRF